MQHLSRHWRAPNERKDDILIVIDCLRTTVTSGATTYPLLIGFLSAEQLVQIAEAPSFTEHTSHEEIATNILAPPIKEWQRPLDAGRVHQIANEFRNEGQLMPNPILLAANATVDAGHITVSQVPAAGAIPTPVWRVNVTVPAQGQQKPLWILDGQHRITGLAASAQAGNPLPLVLLLNDGMAAYSAPMLASLFAQVTTSARSLDILHNEWLTFAFNLAQYSPARGALADQERAAMRTVADLCRTPQLGTNGPPNPFFDEVRFNAHKVAAPIGGGFVYDCVSLQELVRRHYYDRPVVPPAVRLMPEHLAREIGLAYVALKTSVLAPHDESVFLGNADHGQLPMQDGFLIAVLSRLLGGSSPPGGWQSLFHQLGFPTTPWNFRQWIVSLHGQPQLISRKIAATVLSDGFSTGQLPPGTQNLTEYLRGTKATVVVEAAHLTPANHPAAADKVTVPLTKGDVLSRDVSPRRHLRIRGVSSNIGKLTVVDANSPPGHQVHYPLDRGGIVLDPAHHGNPLKLVIIMTHYGDVRSEAYLDVAW
jgi:hypothetical protein